MGILPSVCRGDKKLGKFSEEALRNIREANRKRVGTLEARAAISRANSGNTYAYRLLEERLGGS